MNKQAKVLFASFIYFALIMEQNEDIPDSLKRLYRKLAKITSMYKDNMEDLLLEINDIIQDKHYEIDYLLASVTIIAEYYEQLKGKKKHFQPMKHKEILELQEECLEMEDKHADDTFEYCEFLVSELLK